MEVHMLRFPSLGGGEAREPTFTFSPVMTIQEAIAYYEDLMAKTKEVEPGKTVPLEEFLRKRGLHC